MIVPQLPLALRYTPEQRFESFIAAPEGAVPQLRLLASLPQADWLYLTGAAGSGKTHLCIAVCAAAEQAGRRAAYVPLGAARGRAGEALDALETHDVIAVDGLDAIAGDANDELALFDFHNRARAASQNVVYTANLAPDALPITLPDLRSRLSQCTRITLHSLDDEGRRSLLRDRAQRRGLIVEDAAFDWMLTHVARDSATLIALLESLDRESLAAQRRITVPFLRRIVELDSR